MMEEARRICKSKAQTCELQHCALVMRERYVPVYTLRPDTVCHLEVT
jgi:hypothetical protein